MMKTIRFALLAALLAFAPSSFARDSYGLSISIGSPGYYVAPPVQYYAPPAVIYHHAAPVYHHRYSAPVVYYAPRAHYRHDKHKHHHAHSWQPGPGKHYGRGYR
jgi:hypothetical protein